MLKSAHSRMQNNSLPEARTPEINALEQRALPQDTRERAVFLIARNMIPVIGVLFLGWSALNLVILYFFDTLGSMWALIAALLTQFFGGWTILPWTTRLTNLLWVIGLSLFLVAFLAIPLGMPVFILLMMQQWDWRSAWNDQGFLFGVVSIVILSLFGMLRHALRFHQTPADEKWTRNTFGLLFLRWAAMIFLIFVFAGMLLPFAPMLLVIAYALLVVISELYPERFLAAFDRSYAAPTTTPSPDETPTATQRARWERKRKRRKK
jgi:hypothetical protein